MRPIHLARLDKTRPVVLLTRSTSAERARRVTVAPITSTVLGIPSQVPLDERNGLDYPCAISIDNTLTIEREQLGRQIGWLGDEQESELAGAIAYAFDLDWAGDE